MDNAARTRQRVLALFLPLAAVLYGPVVIVYMLPFAAAMVLLAARIWQAAAPPASKPQPEPAPVPASSR